MRRFCISLVLLFSLCFYIIISNDISYAYTWEDYLDFCSNINNSLITDSDTKWIANRIYNYRGQIESAISNAGLDLDDYNNFYCYKKYASSDNYLIMWNSNTNVTIQYNKIVSGVNYPTYINRN